MDIERIITNLNNTGPGIDGIRPKEIKQYKYLFIPIIKKLINMIIETNVIPDKLKSSTITPIYKKKGKIDSLGSYRPVGSLPVIEKILEKYLHLKMTKYLDEHKIIPQFQHGFQKHKSTYTLLEEVTELINPALDNRMCAVIIALDLKSAFDTISHTGLIKKFKDIGIHNPLLSNYFLNRKQVTKVGNILSDEEVVHSGLVQGGICSPQWYNLYTHDIKYLDLKGEIKMFADDTALISIHKNLNIAIQNAQNDFIMVQKYFYNNSIFINDQKTETIIIGYIHNKLNTFEKITCHSRVCLENNTHGIQCSCPKLEYKSDIRYLGLYIDNDFKFSSHIHIILKKLRIILYRLNKNYVSNLPVFISKTIYYSLVESILRYGVTQYNYAPEYVKKPLRSLQKKIIKKIFYNTYPEYLLTPELLCIQILLENNFTEEKFKQTEQNSYNIRRVHFVKSRAYTNYGTRCLSHLIPTLLEEYCRDFIEETHPRKIKMNIQQRMIEENLKKRNTY
ncbi:hypothetical protein WDU94_015652 [Cyamophila willieti]